MGSRLPMRHVSSKQRARLEEYYRVRGEYLEKNPVCQYPDCGRRSTEIHHRRGRHGKLLCDAENFVGLCGNHHRFAHDNPITARKMGLSEHRNAKKEDV